MNPLHHSLVAKLGGPAISAAVHLSVFAAIAGGGAASARGPARDSIEALALFEAPPVEPAPPAAVPTPPAPAPADAPVRPHAAAAPHATGEHHTHTYPAPPGHDDVPHSPELAHTHDAPAPAASTPGAAGGGPAEAATGAPAEAPAAPRFTMKLGTVAHSLPAAAAPGAGSASGSGESGGAAAGAAEATVPEAQVSSPARVVAASPPAYPPAARAAQVEADVGLELVVDASGRVAEARVVRPAGYGFSESALAAVRAYRFSPAQRAGAPVRVRMRWTVQFRLD